MGLFEDLVGKTSSESDKGRKAESVALQFLEQPGMRLIERNFRCRAAKIDLIMEEPGSLVFIKVRFWTAATFSSALESVDHRKKPG